jgi:hypothetical protein
MDITYRIVNSEISATVILNRKRFIHNVTQRSYSFSLHIFVAIKKKNVCRYSNKNRIIFIMGLDWFLEINATFNKISLISLRSVLLVEEIGVPGESHRFLAGHIMNL